MGSCFRKFECLLAAWFCIFGASNCFAAIEDCLKPVRDRSESNAFGNIDCVYVINLDERPEKYALTESEFAPWGIKPCRFSAVNGWELTCEELAGLGVSYQPWMKKNLWGTSYLPENNGEPSHEVMHVVGKNYFCHCMSRGAIGIVLSHLSILKDAYESGLRRIWICEDDICIPKGANPGEICSLIDELDDKLGEEGWDIFFTDTDTKSQRGEDIKCLSYAQRPDMNPKNPHLAARRYVLGRNFTVVGARYGAYSMIVNRCGMEKLLSHYKKYPIFLPIDMEYTLPENIRLISCRRNIVTTLSNALSDNGSPNYQTKNQ